MEITDVRMRLFQDDAKHDVKAICDITFDHDFVVHDIRVVALQDKVIVAMPSKRMPDGTFKDIAHPINPATRIKITETIFSEYERLKEVERNL